MQPRQLSSHATSAYQILCLVLGIAMMAGSFAAVYYAEGDPWALALPPYFAVICGLLYWIVGRASRVVLAGDALRVERRGQTARIELRDIEAIGASRFTNPERIWLDLRRPSELGSRIHFLPPNRWLRLFSPHPLKADFDTFLATGERVGQLAEGAPEAAWRSAE